MNNRPVPELQTDPEFDELIQPREEKYLEELEENIFDHGCLEPVCVWNGVILDGRLRYKICTKWDIHFNIRRMMFESRDKAVSFICHEQLKRTDLTGEYKKYLIGRLFRADMNTASDEFMKKYPGTELNADGQVSQKYVRKTDIATIIGNEFNFGFSTVTKYDIYARAVDDLRSCICRCFCTLPLYLGLFYSQRSIEMGISRSYILLHCSFMGQELHATN